MKFEARDCIWVYYGVIECSKYLASRTYYQFSTNIDYIVHS